MTTTRPKPAELLALAAVLALAALLRMGWPGISDFKSDEARITALALDLAEGKSLPLHGIATSVGLPKPALSIYLYALPLLLWPNPLSATLFTGALNVLAVALCWWLGRRYWGASAGLCAALLFAAAPWAVMFSRKIWEPDLLAPFALACVATGLLGFIEGRRWALALHLVLLAVLAQLHYPGLLLAPITALLTVLHWRRIDRRSALVGAGLAAVTAIPFLYYLLTRSGEIGQALGGLLSRPASIDTDSVRFWWMMTTGSDIHSLAGWSGAESFLRSVPDIDPARWATGALAVGGLTLWLWLALRRRRTPDAEAGGIVALWALLPLAFFLRRSTPLFAHYYTVAFPAQFLAAGFLLSRAIGSSRPVVRWGALASLVAIAAAQTAMVLALLAFLDTHATPGGFGIPLKYQLQAADRALALGVPVVVVSPGDDVNTSEWPAVFDVLLRRAPHRFVDGAHAALFPGAPATLLVAPGAAAAMQVYSLAGVSGPMSEVPARAGDEPFRVARLGGAPSLTLSPVVESGPLANGAQFVGYRMGGQIAAGRPFEWWIAWRVNWAPDPAADYHIFNHLVDGNGVHWAQADGSTIPAKDWAVGDLVVQVFRLEVAPGAGAGPFWMRVGMYTYPDLKNQSVLDVAGNPAQDAVTLGPLR